MNGMVEVIFSIVAGLGLFMYGMKLMGDGIEKALGEKLRDILERCTKNKLTGLLVGIVFTGIIQSSSAATVLVVGFVNSALMNLYQATGIILGANIGTTVTGQLMALDLSKYAPIIMLVGIIMIMFIKKTIVNKYGEVVLGFGMLFFGMDSMSRSMKQLGEFGSVRSSMQSLDNVWLAILIGIVVTALVQSSSATVGILMVLAAAGMVSLKMSMFAILGSNIGACTSAVLVSIGAKKEARRAAMIHLLFNVIGTVIMVSLLLVVESKITNFIKMFSESSGKLKNDVFVANANSIFKVFQVLIMYPFTNAIVKLTHVIVRGEDEVANDHNLEFIGNDNVFTVPLAVPSAVKEIDRMSEMAKRNLDNSFKLFLGEDEDEKDFDLNKRIEDVYQLEKDVNYMNQEITKYLVKVNQNAIPIADRVRIGALFHAVADIERIGDHAENIVEYIDTMKEEKIDFSNIAKQELSEMYEKVSCLLDFAFDSFLNENDEHLAEVIKIEDEVDEMQKEFQNNHVSRLIYDMCSPAAGRIFASILADLERVADHGMNIAFAIKEARDNAKEKTVKENEYVMQ